MGTRSVLQVFETYQRERVTFVTAVAEMAKSPPVRASAALLRAPFVLNSLCYIVLYKK